MLAAACSDGTGGGEGGSADGGQGGDGGAGQGGNGGQGGGGAGQGGSGGQGGAGGAGGGQGGSGGAGGSAKFCYSPASSIPFDRTCSGSADCSLKFHMVDCCGSLAAVGINANDGAAFDAAESMCQALCDCVAKPTVADDGKSGNDSSAFQVSCVAGKCKTSVP